MWFGYGVTKSNNMMVQQYNDWKATLFLGNYNQQTWWCIEIKAILDLKLENNKKLVHPKF
jgi:hypothetical protein